MGMNSGPSGKRYKRGYRLLIKAGVENAMAKGYLFGFPIDKTKKVAIIPSRGKVIWPDPPTGKVLAAYRDHHYGRSKKWYTVPFDIEAQPHALPVSG